MPTNPQLNFFHVIQVFVMDDRNRMGRGAMRHSGLSSRFGESIPDYDEVQVSATAFVLPSLRC